MCSLQHVSFLGSKISLSFYTLLYNLIAYPFLCCRDFHSILVPGVHLPSYNLRYVCVFYKILNLRSEFPKTFMYKLICVNINFYFYFSWIDT